VLRKTLASAICISITIPLEVGKNVEFSDLHFPLSLSCSNKKYFAASEIIFQSFIYIWGSCSFFSGSFEIYNIFVDGLITISTISGSSSSISSE